MKELKIGEYVRLDNGYIYQWKNNDYEWIYEEDGQLVYGNGANEYEWESNIINHSFDIIDLIEVGDYVNGRKVREVFDLGFGKCFYFKNEYGRHYDKTYQIKSIVTKEQFESMEYRIGE